MVHFEQISNVNIADLTRLSLHIWTDSNYDEEYKCFQKILESNKETCFLAKYNNEYIAFIHLSLRSEYVEGTTSNCVTYIEGIYVNVKNRRKGIASQLMLLGANWGRDQGVQNTLLTQKY